MFLVQLLVAGNETTRNMMSGGLLGFAERPGAVVGAARTSVGRGHLGPLPVAVEEMLRWTTPVVSFMRTTTRSDPSWPGTGSAAGEPVLMLYASANRDESVFGPDRRPVRRRPRPQPPRRLRVRSPLLHRGGAGPARGPDPARGAAGPLRLGRGGRTGGADRVAGHRRHPVGAAGLRARLTVGDEKSSSVSPSSAAACAASSAETCSRSSESAPARAVLLEVLDGRGPRDREDHGRVVEQPGECDLARGGTGGLGHLADHCGRPGQLPGRDRCPREEPDLLGLAEREQLVGRAVGQVETVLDADDRDDLGPAA